MSNERNLEKDSPASSATGGEALGTSKGYVPAPNFVREEKSTKGITKALLLAAIVASAICGWQVSQHIPDRAPASVQATFSLKPNLTLEKNLREAIEKNQLPPEFKNLPREAQVEVLSGKRKVYDLFVVEAGTIGDVAAFSSDGIPFGEMNLGMQGAVVHLALLEGRQNELKEQVTAAASHGTFSVITDSGERITRSMRVGESISWKVMPK